MADVYVLASPQPTLYAYPSQLHPTPPTPTPTPGVPFGQAIYPPFHDKRRSEELALVILGAL